MRTKKEGNMRHSARFWGLGAVVALTFLSSKINDLFSKTGNKLNDSTP